MQPMTLSMRTTALSAVLLYLTLGSIAGCRDASQQTGPGEIQTVPKTPTTPNTPTTGVLTISGAMTPLYQSIRLTRRGVPVTDAVVTVNGYVIPHYAGDLYSGSLPVVVPAGGTLNLKVIAGTVTFEAPGEVIPMPVITSPLSGTTFAYGDSVQLTWSSPANPDQFSVCLNCWENSLDGAIYYTSGSAREFMIPPGTLTDYGKGTPITVSARKINFLKSADTPEVATSVEFWAHSNNAVVRIKY